jgi:hypothetical protein
MCAGQQTRIAMSDSPTIQYSFTIKEQYGIGKRSYYAATNGTCDTLDKAMEEAREAFRNKDEILSVFSIDMDTGQITTIHQAMALYLMFDQMEVDEYNEKFSKPVDFRASLGNVGC